eukprot:sb/3461302/
MGLRELLSVNHILRECAESRQISYFARKGFLLYQNGNYFIPSDKAITNEWGSQTIFYRYVDYHTDRDSLYYTDNACFNYVYHQYKRDVRDNKISYGAPLLTQLCAMEVYILALVFGDLTCHKPHKFIKHYKDFTEDPLLSVEAKDTKMAVSEAVKNLKSIKTEFACMEHYLTTVDNHHQANRKNSKGVWYECVDIMKNQGLSEATITIFKDKLEIVLNESNNNINRTKSQRKELYYAEFSDPKLSINAYEEEHRVDVITQNGRYGIMFSCVAGSASSDKSASWRNFVVLLFYYANLQYPVCRRDPCAAEVVSNDGRCRTLHKKSCPLILEMPPIHYKLTRQDTRTILRRYGTQDGWYILHTFEAPPKPCDVQHTNGELQLSYCMNGEVCQITITFSQEVGFGKPASYRTTKFRGKKFTTPYELIDHFSVEGKRLHTFITTSMVADISVPDSVLFPMSCVQERKSLDQQVREGTFYYSLTDTKHDVRLEELPSLFWHGAANSRVSAIIALVRSMCATEPIHENLVRLFGLCQDSYGARTSVLTENYGVPLYDYLRENSGQFDCIRLLSMSHQIASGLLALHTRRIVHGFPVLHNCFIDTTTRVVKLGGLGVLRLGIEKQRLEGEVLETEQPSFKDAKSLGEGRFHPSRWLPKESLFDQQFTEETDSCSRHDLMFQPLASGKYLSVLTREPIPTNLSILPTRWCFGVALWQLFHDAQLPMSHITDAMLMEQLGKSRDDWYKPHLAVVNSNEFLTAMLENTIQYCLRTDVVDSVSKVVQLLDTRYHSPIECGYTFANLDSKPDNLEELRMEEVNGQICFTSADLCRVFDNYEDLNGYDEEGCYLGEEEEEGDGAMWGDDDDDDDDDDDGGGYGEFGGDYRNDDEHEDEQLFHDAQLPMSHITDAMLMEQLGKSRDDWYKPHLAVVNSNEFLTAMLENTIQYCLSTDVVDSVSKVVQLLDTRYHSPIECGYTFANLDSKPDNLEELRMEEVNGQICFTSADLCRVFDNYEDLNGYDEEGCYLGEEEEEGDGAMWGDDDDDDDDDDDGGGYGEFGGDYRNDDEHEDEQDYIGGLCESGAVEEEITITNTIIGQGNFASVYIGRLRNNGAEGGSEVAVKVFHPEIKAVDIQKEINAMQQLKHEYIIPLRGE